MKIPEFPELTVCVKTDKGMVLEQNDTGIHLCGNLKDQVCTKECMRLLDSQSDSEKLKTGFHLFEKRKIGDQNFDIVILKKPGYIISTLHPTKESNQDLSGLMEKASLTKREREVLSLRVSEGLTLKEICEKLFISRATIRTHINNINKKISGFNID